MNDSISFTNCKACENCTSSAQNYSMLANETIYNCDNMNDNTAAIAGVDGKSIAIVTIYGLICILGLVGNVLVIFVVTRYSKMKTVTNLYILNLSIADGLFLLGMPLMMTTVLLRRWVFGYALCKIYFTLTCINMFTSSLTLTAMSIDRYFAVCFPITAMRYRTPLYSLVVLLVTWIAAGVFMLPVVLYARTEWRNGTCGDQATCVMVWPAEQQATGQVAYAIYTLLLGFVFPVAIIIVLYSMLITRLRNGVVAKRQSAAHKHRKVTRLVTLIIAVYIVCMLPYWVFQMCLVLINVPGGLPDWVLTVYKALTILMYTNSMVNPLLYAFTNEAFRQSFICAFRCAADPFIGRPVSEVTKQTREACNSAVTARGQTDVTLLYPKNAGTQETRLDGDEMEAFVDKQASSE